MFCNIRQILKNFNVGGILFVTEMIIMIFWIVFSIVVGIAFLILLTSFICFMMAFYASRKVDKNAPEFDIPPGKIYEPYREQMIAWMKEAKAMPCREFTMRSFDGLTLHGKYYECKKGAPIELMMHGYRGTAERDLCGGIQRCFSLGRNCLIIDQRACGKSDGHVITFGVKEHRDCLDWVDLIIKNIDKDARIILCGISMGASTVLMASAKELPKNVVGVLADCGFTSAKEIIQKVIRQMGLPAKLLYPFVRLGALVFGGFNLEETPAVEAVKNAKVPVILYHGTTDDFVPCEMSVKNFEACKAAKQLVTIENAGHGLCYLVEPQKYLETLAEFSREHYKIECDYHANT